MDDVDQFVCSVAVGTGEADQRLGLLYHCSAVGGAGDRDASAAAELEQALVAKLAQGPEDGVGVDAENGGEVLRGRQALARLGFSVCDRPADLAGDLLVKVGRVASVDLDIQHDANQSSISVLGVNP
jgi:hypothetical protein